MEEHPDTTDAIRCPECGDVLEGELGEVPMNLDGETICVDVECPRCDAPLELVVESALPDALGVDLAIVSRD